MKNLIQIIQESKTKSREYFRKECQKKIERLGKEKLKKQKECYCPKCQRKTKYIKKGKRRRSIKTSEGMVEFELQQLKCKQCNRIYRPLIYWLKLKPRQIITDELLDKTIQIAINTSYRTAANITETFTQEKLSSRTIQKAMIKKGEQVRRKQQQEESKKYKAILKDSTKGNTGKTKRGEDINIAFGISGRKLYINPDTREIKRQRLIGDILHVSVGEDSAFQDIQHQTRNVMTDGDRSIKNRIKHLPNHKENYFASLSLAHESNVWVCFV